ncbi:MAG: polysaccharide deacetylase family protein [Candidatus Borkfalkiaceae bacterium]|nr:polysaccharide deacetylase family protein [Christensenellaceae bacterium]
MKNRSERKLSVISNAVIGVVLTAVFVLGFSYDKSAPIYGGETIGAIYRGNAEKNTVSLMFNVYENTEIVNNILETLKEKGVKATFFVGGCWADDNALTLQKIIGYGNELGNHGYFHKDHKKLDYEGNKQEIYITELIVKSLCGEKTTLFAPPSGSFSDVTLDAASDLGYKVIMWSKDTIDWRDKDSSLVYKRATGNPASGDLILMHPKPHTLSALPQIIDFYLINGFTFCTVGENVT